MVLLEPCGARILVKVGKPTGLSETGVLQHESLNSDLPLLANMLKERLKKTDFVDDVS